jgi:hypothetical protein
MLQCIANPKFPTPKSEQWTCKSDGLCRRPAATISEPSSAGGCVGKQEQEAGGCWKIGGDRAHLPKLASPSRPYFPGWAY